MAADVKRSAQGWTSTQAYVMAVVCLVIGVAVGYLLRGSSTSQPQAGTAAPSAMMPGVQAQLTPEQLKQMADTQAEPLLERLKTNPKDPALLADVGNLYYDAQQYAAAVDYYQRSLNIVPGNTDVRTDMGTAIWYLGDADKAIEQFNVVLQTHPTKSNTLLNLGIVQWQGKMDAKAAVASWEKLLATNPGFEGREKVQELIAQAKKHTDVKPGTKTDKPAM